MTALKVFGSDPMTDVETQKQKAVAVHSDQAGLFAGDVIISIGGHAVTSPGSLTALVSRCRPGTQVALAWVAPGGSLHTAVVTLAAGPAG